MKNVAYLSPILFIIIFSCVEKLNKRIITKKQGFNIDYYYTIDLEENLTKDTSYIKISNDTIYLLESYFNCEMIWKIGYLGNSDKIISLNNNCNTTTIVDNLISQKTNYFTMEKDTTYVFYIEMSSNGYLDESKSKRNIIYSRDKGIISVIKYDTINLAPFY